ncbi:hypothetical protein RKD24_006119 [Streptomyces calvus]
MTSPTSATSSCSPPTRTRASPASCTDCLGPTVGGQEGDTVHLRAYDDYEHHSLVLTARDRPGLAAG